MHSDCPMILLKRLFSNQVELPATESISWYKTAWSLKGTERGIPFRFWSMEHITLLYSWFKLSCINKTYPVHTWYSIAICNDTQLNVPTKIDFTMIEATVTSAETSLEEYHVFLALLLLHGLIALSGFFISFFFCLHRSHFLRLSNTEVLRCCL